MPTRQLRARKRDLALAGVALTAALTASVFAVQPAAMAGTNGQQLRLCTGYNSNGVNVEGNNQDGAYTRTYVDLTNRDGNGCAELPDVWWKGTVSLTWGYSADPRMISKNDCVVPDDQADDYFTCVDSNGGDQQPEPSGTETS